MVAPALLCIVLYTQYALPSSDVWNAALQLKKREKQELDNLVGTLEREDEQTNSSCPLRKRELRYLCPSNPVVASFNATTVAFVYIDDEFSGFFAMITDILNQLQWFVSNWGQGNVAAVVAFSNKKYASDIGCQGNLWDSYFMPVSAVHCPSVPLQCEHQFNAWRSGPLLKCVQRGRSEQLVLVMKHCHTGGDEDEDIPAHLQRACAIGRPAMVRSLHEDGVIQNYYYGDKLPKNTSLFDFAWYDERRRAARSLLGDFVRIRPQILRKVSGFARTHLNCATDRHCHIIGIHMRGTDKVFAGLPQGPEVYEQLVKRYLQAHSPSDVVVFIATDTSAWLRQLTASLKALGVKAVSTAALRSDDYTATKDAWAASTPWTSTNVKGAHNIIWSTDPRTGYKKGEDVLLDALLLAHSDFLLCSSSAVSEFAIYFNPELSRRSINAQFRCGHLRTPTTSQLLDQSGCLHATGSS
jgi:hypothetical protein